jgi:Relaxase/Mobilisation nuclease domain
MASYFTGSHCGIYRIGFCEQNPAFHMIVKVIRAGAAGHGRALVHYVLDLKGERQIAGLGEDVLDLKHAGEKVEWARTCHTGVDDPRWAFPAMERHNAQNTRKHRISRYQHVIVSFAEGERPTRAQMAVIEDRLMEVIGFGDHPRVSAVHRNTDNLHLHIAVSRIDPTTLKAEHPRLNHFTLQAEAARIEIDLGLRQERKTLLPRERAEIDRRLGLDPDPPLTPTPGQHLQSIGEMHERVSAIAAKGVEQARQTTHGLPTAADQAHAQRHTEPKDAQKSPRVPEQHSEASATPRVAQEAHAARQRTREEIEAAEIDQWADKVQGGHRPLTVEDVARSLSPQYQAAVDDVRSLTEQIGKATRALDDASVRADVARYRIQESRGTLGFIGRVLHDRAWWRNQDLSNWQRSLRGAEYGRKKEGTRLKLAQDQLVSAEIRAREALERVRPEAELALKERKQIGENAREQLKEIRESERLERRERRRLQL